MEKKNSAKKDNVDPDEKKWNNQQDSETKKQNEESQSESVSEHLNNEIEIDENGNKKIVHRARPTSEKVDKDVENTDIRHKKTGNEAIENEKSLENKDLNYDTNASRYPDSHPDNQHNRGNIKLDDQ